MAFGLRESDAFSKPIPSWIFLETWGIHPPIFKASNRWSYRPLWNHGISHSTPMIVGWIPFVSCLNPRKMGKTQKSWGVNQIPPNKNSCAWGLLHVSQIPQQKRFHVARLRWPSAKQIGHGRKEARCLFSLRGSVHHPDLIRSGWWMVFGWSWKTTTFFFTLIYHPFSGKSLGS